MGYIARARRHEKGGRTDGARNDPQVPLPAGHDGRAGLRGARGNGQLAQGLIQEGPGGPGGPPPSQTISLPQAQAGPPNEAPPAERRVYRVGNSVFRVWVNRLQAGAEYFMEGEWVWTPIPSSSIIDHPQATELAQEDLTALWARFGGDPWRPATRGLRR